MKSFSSKCNVLLQNYTVHLEAHVDKTNNVSQTFMNPCVTLQIYVLSKPGSSLSMYRSMWTRSSG